MDYIGQTEIIEEFMNGIRHDSLSHAFVLTGEKGIGKRTLARFIAKALLCTEKGDAQIPCGHCRACRSFDKNVNPDFMKYRAELLKILQEEGRLTEIVKLVGSDILADDQKLILETGRAIRLGFLQQAAFNPIDTYVPLKKQFLMMETILYLHNRVSEIIKKGVAISQILKLGLFDRLTEMKFTIGNDELDKFEKLKEEIDGALSKFKD